MGAFTLVIFLAAPLLLFQLLPQTSVKAIQVTFADANTGSETTNAGDGTSDESETGMEDGWSRNASEVAARNSLLNDMFGDRVSEDDMMAVVCDSLQDKVEECNTVPTFRDYMEVHRRAPGNSVPTKRRRKRFSSFGSSFGSFFNPSSLNGGLNSFVDPWPNTNLGSTNLGSTNLNSINNINSFGHAGFSSGGFGDQGIICPSAQDQSLTYQLNPDSTNYPAALIGQELLLDAVTRDCLTREIVLETDPPRVIVEDFRLTANATCAFTQLRLWSYQSQSARAVCWIMQNFQENVLYRQCADQFCRDCKDKFQSFGNIDDRLSQKLCLTDYRVESVWAFCPSLVQGQRIIRDRIIIPISCQCQRIRCEPIPRWKK